MSEYGGPGEIRTPDLTVRSRSLYPTELRAPKIILLQGLRIIVFAVIRHRPEWRFFTWNGAHFPVDETISAFGLMVFCRPTRICIVPWNRDSFAGYVALCHLLARYLADSTPKEKKKQLDEHSKGF